MGEGGWGGRGVGRGWGLLVLMGDLPFPAATLWTVSEPGCM